MALGGVERLVRGLGRRVDGLWLAGVSSVGVTWRLIARRFRWIRYLDVSATDLGDAEAVLLGSLPLEAVDVRRTGLGEAGVAALCRNPSLQRMYVDPRASIPDGVADRVFIERSPESDGVFGGSLAGGAYNPTPLAEAVSRIEKEDPGGALDLLVGEPNGASVVVHVTRVHVSHGPGGPSTSETHRWERLAPVEYLRTLHEDTAVVVYRNYPAALMSLRPITTRAVGGIWTAGSTGDRPISPDVRSIDPKTTTDIGSTWTCFERKSDVCRRHKRIVAAAGEDPFAE